MRVSRLSRESIEGASLSLLAGYKQKYPDANMLPVPVDDIVECFLELDFSFTDLIGAFKMPDVLGALWINERKVCIDQSLDPSEHPSAEGRYRYTVAHEGGHWVLHRHYFFNNSSQPVLFDVSTEPSIVCRSGQKKEPIEWQADTFASYLLMPRDAILNAWQELNGTAEPYDATEEILDLQTRWGRRNGFTPTVQKAREVAQLFKVSGQAMQIRLESLGLIRQGDGQKRLL